jgi:hypothetical protein
MAIYVLFATDKSVIWNTFFYVSIFGFILSLLLERKLTPVNWCGIVFTGEILLFMLSLVNKDYITYYNYCTSFNFSIVISASIAITLILTIILQRKWITRKYGKL